MPVRRLFALLVLLSLSLASSAAPVSFLDSAEMLKSPQYGFARASRAEIDAARKRLPASFSVSPFLEDEDLDWYRHRGDLVLDRPLSNGHALIIEGNLRIRGSYDDYRNNTGLLIVLGDMQVENVVSWGSLAVAGHLKAEGLIFAYYNDFTFDAKSVAARALFVYDKSGSVGKVDAPIWMSSEKGASKGSVQRAVQTLMPEVVLPALADADDDALTDGFYPDFTLLQRRIAAGEPLFRSQPGADTLLADLRLASGERVSAAQIDTLAGKDRLLAATLASREDLSPASQNRVLATRDPLVLDRLARNPATTTAVLERIAAVSAPLASVVITHPKAPSALVGKLAASGPAEVRRTSAGRADLPADQLAQLAKDRDASVRLALVDGNGHRLPAPVLAQLVADADPKVRAAVAAHRLLRLDASALARLAKDPASEVRLALAERLLRQVRWEQWPELPLTELEGLALSLAEDTEGAVANTSRLALAPSEQERRWLKATPAARTARAAALAGTTRGERVQLDIARGQHADALEELAGNLALWPTVQNELMRTLPPAKNRRRIGLLDHDAASKALDGPEGVVKALLENPNATPAVIEQAARYCADTFGNALFCSALTHRKDLSPKVIEMLRTAYRGEEREDLALTILLQPGASEAQLKWAVPVWMDDEADVLAEFKPIQKLQGEAFWQALATARHPKLRELAATNAQTPAAALQRLARDKVDDVASSAWRNPNLPLPSAESLSLDQLHALLGNPALPRARIEALLTQARAQGKGNIVADCLELLAAQSLRPPASP